ncbi:MAG: hypothetical protein HY327_12955, partial [Chloroflexi bacterium]|nr:hypothetical protein [Chloroflexota bacterium]
MKSRSRLSSSIAIPALSFAFSCSLWLFYFASVAYARDCPPNDPSRSDCAAAATTAQNPAVPAAGTLAGGGAGVLINRGRPGPPPKPPKDYGPGRTNVWDPTVEEQQNRWIKDGLVWDPTTLTWRPPRPGEIPPPPDAPEEPPPYERQHPRDKTPVECLDLYDAYVKMQARAIALEAEIQAASQAQWDAQFKLNQLLAKFTLKLGWDVADTVT